MSKGKSKKSRKKSTEKTDILHRAMRSLSVEEDKPDNPRLSDPARVPFPKQKQKVEQPPKKSRKTIRKQRNRRILISVIAVLSLLAVGTFLSLRLLFIVREVEVTGTERYTPEEIISFCAIPLEENVFLINTDEYEKTLPENFTYIESAVVKRKLPDKISIEVKDAVPSYYTVHPEGDTLVYTVYSRGFKELTRQAQRPEGLVLIDADISDKATKKNLNALIKAIRREGCEGITGIHATGTEVSAVYEGRLTFSMGSVTDLDYKLRLAYTVATENLEPGQRGTIDCSTRGSAIFTPRA